MECRVLQTGDKHADQLVIAPGKEGVPGGSNRSIIECHRSGFLPDPLNVDCVRPAGEVTHERAVRGTCSRQFYP